MKKIHRLLAGLFATVLTIGCLSSATVKAAENTEGGFLTYDALLVNLDGANECEVSCVINSSFTVTIPKYIRLAGDVKEAVYEVCVEGNIAGNQTIIVAPESSFAMAEAGGKKDITAQVAQPVTRFVDAEVSTEDTIGSVHAEGGAKTEGKVSAPLTAGTWSGHFFFNISVDGEILDRSEAVSRNQQALALAYIAVENKTDDITLIVAADAEAAAEQLKGIYSSVSNDCEVSIINTAYTDGILTYAVKLSKGLQSITTQPKTVAVQ